jgi:hypothetical protein
MIDRHQFAAALKASGNNLKKVRLPDSDSAPVATEQPEVLSDTVVPSEQSTPVSDSAESLMHKARAANKSDIPVSEWVARIDALIKRRQKTVFEIGDLLLQAKQGLKAKDFAAVIKQSRLRSKSNAENYMRVASKTVFRQPDVEKDLPSGVGALIDIAAWTDEEITRARDCGALNPDATRKTLKEWIELHRTVPADPNLIALTNTSFPRNTSEPGLLLFIDEDDWTEEQVDDLTEFVMTETNNKFGKRVTVAMSPATSHKLHLKSVRERKRISNEDILPCIPSPSVANEDFEETVKRNEQGNV